CTATCHVCYRVQCTYFCQRYPIERKRITVIVRYANGKLEIESARILPFNFSRPHAWARQQIAQLNGSPHGCKSSWHRRLNIDKPTPAGHKRASRTWGREFSFHDFPHVFSNFDNGTSLIACFDIEGVFRNSVRIARHHFDLLDFSTLNLP